MYHPTQTRDQHGKWTSQHATQAALQHIQHAKNLRDDGKKLAAHQHVAVAHQHMLKAALAGGNPVDAEKHLLKLDRAVGAMRAISHHSKQSNPTLSDMAAIKATQYGKHLTAARNAVKTHNPDLIHPVALPVPQPTRDIPPEQLQNRDHHLSLVRVADHHARNLQNHPERDGKAVARRSNWQRLSATHTSLAHARDPQLPQQAREKHLDDARHHLLGYKNDNRDHAHLSPKVTDEHRMHYEEGERGIRDSHRELGLPPLAPHLVGDATPHHQNPQQYHDQWHRTLSHPGVQQDALNATAPAYRAQVDSVRADLASAHQALRYANDTQNSKLRNPGAKKVFLQEASTKMDRARDKVRELPSNQVHQHLKDALEGARHGVHTTREHLEAQHQ